MDDHHHPVRRQPGAHVLPGPACASQLLVHAARSRHRCRHVVPRLLRSQLLPGAYLELQQGLWLAGRGHRPHAVALHHLSRRADRRRIQRRTGQASNENHQALTLQSAAIGTVLRRALVSGTQRAKTHAASSARAAKTQKVTANPRYCTSTPETMGPTTPPTACAVASRPSRVLNLPLPAVRSAAIATATTP